MANNKVADLYIILVIRMHDSGIILTEEMSDAVTLYSRHGAHFTQSTNYYASSIVISIQKLYMELQQQHQHDEKALAELNQRFRLLINRVQLLTSEQSEYIEKLATFWLRYSGFDSLGAQWGERYLHHQSDLTMINNAKVDYEVDVELSQLQIGIYRRLIEVEEQHKSERQSKLERELKESASVLVTLRASYKQMESEVGSFYAAREDMLKQHLTVTREWCGAMKQRKRWELNLHTVKNQIACYNRLRSYLVQ